MAIFNENIPLLIDSNYEINAEKIICIESIDVSVKYQNMLFLLI